MNVTFSCVFAVFFLFLHYGKIKAQSGPVIELRVLKNETNETDLQCISKCGQLEDDFEPNETTSSASRSIETPTQWPWLAKIYQETERDSDLYTFKSFGILVSCKVVITTADDYLEDELNLDVYLNPDKSDAIVPVYPVGRIYHHPSYRFEDPEQRNNIVVLLLTHDVTITPASRPICLPNPDTNFDNELGYISTWNQNEEHQVLRANRTDCSKWRRTLVSSSHLCGSEINYEGSCPSNRGSGFAIKEKGRWVLRGIIDSWLVRRNALCTSTTLFKYLDVRKYSDWITFIQQKLYSKVVLELILRSYQRKVYNISVESCGDVPIEFKTKSLVIGGADIPRGSWPWLAAIYRIQNNNSELICGGTLVSQKTIITAAHCFIVRQGYSNASDLNVYLGRHDIAKESEEDSVRLDLQSILINPDYNPGSISSDADIALIFFTAVTFTDFIKPACIWGTQLPAIGEDGYVAGWGRYGTGEERKISKTPLRISARVVGNGNCLLSNSEFSNIVTNRTFCAGHRDGTGPCQGDSGGGLLIKNSGNWYLRGVVSTSLSNPAFTCDLNSFVVYCDVAGHLQWLSTTIQY